MMTTFNDTSYLNKSLFQIGDIVLYCWKPGYSRWHKGKIVSNNFAMLNLPDFFGKPEYYISKLDENDNVINTQKSVAIDKDSKYLVKFKPGMEWCIGKNSNVVPYVKEDRKEDRKFDERDKEAAENWKNMAAHLSYADMINASPALKAIAENEDKRYKELNDKLDNIIEKLNLLLLIRPSYPVYPDYPWTTTPQPITPWYEQSPKINCDINKSETEEKKSVYTGHLNWKECYPYEKYVSTYGDSEFDEFCKKYNNMSTTEDCKRNYKD